MVLTIDTDHKTILFSGCDMAEAVYFARLHEFDGYTVKKDLPGYKVSFSGDFRSDEFNPEKVFRNILGEQDPEYLQFELVQSNPTVSHIDAHLYTEIDGFGYYFVKGLTCDPTKRV